MIKSSRIYECLDSIRLAGEKGLITFITAGDPCMSDTVEISLRMAKAGADIIELGVPFSDPLADGPVIQRASQRALGSGVTLTRIFDGVREIRKNCGKPLVLMGYYNPIYKYGIRRFAADAFQAGINGLIVPDLPYEESGPLREAARETGLDLIPLVAPTTTGSRLEKITADARGFIYCVSVTGVTGARKEVNENLEAFTGMVRRHTALPLAVGFGIAEPAQAARAALHCDAVVVGSAIVSIIAEFGKASVSAPKVEVLIRQIRSALDHH
jgi:tryptophan synthase alpha chain